MFQYLLDPGAKEAENDEIPKKKWLRSIPKNHQGIEPVQRRQTGQSLIIMNVSRFIVFGSLKNVAV